MWDVRKGAIVAKCELVDWANTDIKENYKAKGHGGQLGEFLLDVFQCSAVYLNEEHQIV